jgi:hypothetical protein
MEISYFSLVRVKMLLLNNDQVISKRKDKDI